MIGEGVYVVFYLPIFTRREIDKSEGMKMYSRPRLCILNHIRVSSVPYSSRFSLLLSVQFIISLGVMLIICNLQVPMIAS